MTRKAIPKHIKETVWKRYIGADRTTGECFAGCGVTILITNFEVGHNRPRSKGGSDNITNLRPICPACNKGMGNRMSIETWKAKYFGKAKSTKERITKAVTVRDRVQTHLTKQGLEQEGKGVDFKEKAKIKDKSQELEARRVKTEEAIRLPYSLPLNFDHAHVIHLDLANKEKIETSAKLKWLPFYRVSYRLNFRRIDPAKKPYRIEDSGFYIVNALFQNALGKKETEVFRKELEQTPAEDKSYEEQGNNRPIILKEHVSLKDAREQTIDYVIQKNTKSIWYDVPPKKRKRKDDLGIFDEDERRKWELKPSRKDVRIAAIIPTVYAPKWEIDFQSRNYKYSKSLSGNTGAVLEDNITYCSKPSHEDLFGSKKKNVAVCDTCGQALCQEHIFRCTTCNLWLCGKDIIQCVVCRKRFCPDHIKNKCIECSKPLCDTCTTECPICGEIHCDGHMTKCSRCGKSVCVSCTKKAGGLFFQKTVCKNCE